MPEIARFYGIVIKMFFDDHNPPHFHAILGTKDVVSRASKLTQLGIKSKDALHVASALEGKAEYFLTTDDKLINKLTGFKELVVINPVSFIPILEEA